MNKVNNFSNIQNYNKENLINKKLPKEIFEYILSMLGNKDLQSTSCVNKIWGKSSINAAKSKEIFKFGKITEIFKSIFNQLKNIKNLKNLKEIKKSSNEIKRIIYRNFTSINDEEFSKLETEYNKVNYEFVSIAREITKNYHKAENYFLNENKNSLKKIDIDLVLELEKILTKSIFQYSLIYLFVLMVEKKGTEKGLVILKKINEKDNEYIAINAVIENLIKKEMFNEALFFVNKLSNQSEKDSILVKMFEKIKNKDSYLAQKILSKIKNELMKLLATGKLSDLFDNFHEVV